MEKTHTKYCITLPRKYRAIALKQQPILAQGLIIVVTIVVVVVVVFIIQLQ